MATQAFASIIVGGVEMKGEGKIKVAPDLAPAIEDSLKRLLRDNLSEQEANRH